MNKEVPITIIQRYILDLFVVFKKICKQNNLTYFAIGGTCLGAVRHKGFIPWDDDMDVAMPYEDYKKFLKIVSQELPTYFDTLEPLKSMHWSGNFLKIHNSNTTFIDYIRLAYPDAYTGIFLDIMPIYGLPKKENSQLLLAWKLNILLRKNMTFRFTFRENKSFGDKIFWMLSLKQRLTHKSFYYFIQEIETQFGKLKFDNSNKILFGWRMQPLVPWHHTNYKQIFEYKDFSSSIEVPFENTTIAIPVGYNNYLKMDFGDYMQLPPEEKRKPCHGNAIIDIERPYSYYQRRNTK